MLAKICSKTGKKFTVSDKEMEMRRKFGIDSEPDVSPVFRFMQLGAFWQHWNLYKRKCDRTGKDIFSVFRPDCPYPIWHKDEWLKHSDPPSAEFDPEKPFFEQAWEIFQESPIAHNIGGGNENCEYTDDWWYGKNCYLCHSGYKCEDVKYCYRTLRSRDCQFCILSEDNELCIDLINSHNCFNASYCYNCHSCNNSAFLYDCRNCENCMFCWNLRNKKYCFGNQQLTKEEYEKKKQEWDLASIKTYGKAKKMFSMIMSEKAWFKALNMEKSENSTGDYLDQCKGCENCYFVTSGAEDCVNIVRAGAKIKDCLDNLGPAFNSELVYMSSAVQDSCYANSFCHDTVQCRYVDYCAHCFQCENCFGCCGLVGKKYCILNKEYSKEEYELLRNKIIDYMKKTGEYGRFFPGYFAANSYDESWSSFYWSLNKEEQEKYGFRSKPEDEKRESHYLDASEIPDNCHSANESLSQKIFWDDEVNKPFQIQKTDIDFSKKMNVPLMNCFYIKRIQENFRMIPFSGETRTVKCGKCKIETQTSWTEEYNGRILCEKCYQQEIY